MRPVVLDTNIFIAAAFKPRSASGRIIEAARGGRFRVVWDERTKAETKKLVTQIPPTRSQWPELERVFMAANKHHTAIPPEAFAGTISDPDDRKFAALAEDTGAIIITNDDDLLGTKDQTGLPVMTPGAFWKEYNAAAL
jgi:putative PIN family toxin of toxin-antitoxin system